MEPLNAPRIVVTSTQIDTPHRPSKLLGVLFLLAGLALNPWAVGWTFAPDGQIDGALKIGCVVLVQIVALLLGVGLMRGRPRLGSTLLSACLGLSALGAALFFGYQTSQFLEVRGRSREQLSVLRAINKSEDLLQWLTPQFRHLNKAALNLDLPDGKAEKLFGESVEFTGLDAVANQTESSERELARVESLPLSSGSVRRSRDELAIWPAFFATVDYFEHAKFYLVRGEFEADDPTAFATDMGFAALARMRSGHYAYVSSKLHVLWRDHTTPDAEDPVWLIEAWETAKFELTHARDLFFRDVLDSVIVDAGALAEARRSIHEEKVLAHLTEEDWETPPWFSNQAQDRHPGVSVVDLNGDGFDDLFVLAHWGPNLFFMNRGDGTFEERAEALGLARYENTSSAIFADFDNDGDQDVMLGRTLAPSVFLANEEGSFVDRTSTAIAVPLPSLVSSVSVVDYDGDGLLDVYFSTYASRMMHQEMTADADADLPVLGPAVEGAEGVFLADFLSNEDSRELHHRFHSTGHPVHDRAGPPNRLFHNTGDGRFELAAESVDLEGWHHTYQSTWTDFDGDGDQDVYLANDFAPNNLIRNDGAAGFTDITEESNAADIGFGMGAGWGDYDNDGDEDLYVVNMFSKAGRRITAQIQKLNPVFGNMARGNSLLENRDGKFERVSGLQSPALMVEKAGWSWGGQFVDFDNDSNLDVVALSGYYTAPEEVEIPVDT